MSVDVSLPSAGPARPRRQLRRLCVGLALALAPFVLLELGLRILGLEYPPLFIPVLVWTAEEDQRLDDETSLHRRDEAHFWLPRPGAAIPWADPGADPERVSSGGFRGEDPDERARIRVLVLGDSSTFGWGVRGEECYGEQLERRLQGLLGEAARGERSVQVLNGGVIGSTMFQGVVRYRVIAERWKPDIVVEAFGCSNDHVPAYDLTDREKQALFASRDDPLPKAMRWARVELRCVHLAAYLLDSLRGGRDALLAERIEQGRAERRALKNYVEHPDYKRRVPPEDFSAALAELEEAVRRDGGRLVCLHMPRAAFVERERPPVLDYDPLVVDFARREGLELVPAYERFRAQAEKGVPDRELLFDGGHPTAKGHALIAEWLFEFLQDDVSALDRIKSTPR